MKLPDISFRSIGRNSFWALGLLLIFAIAASLQDYLLFHFDENANPAYTNFNNYMIFSYSFHHLWEGKDLYIAYPYEYWDLYKYSPAFALAFGFFTLFPVVIGLSLWNMLNSLVLFLGLKSHSRDHKMTWLMVIIVAVETLTSLQTHQSNGIMAGLILLAFSQVERKNLFWATGLLMLSVFIKLFSLAAFVIFLFYPNKLKAALYSILWFIILFFIPLLATDFSSLMDQYISWWNMLGEDHSASYGFSVMGWLHSWFGLEEGKNLVLLSGTMILLAPLTQIRKWKNINFRKLFLTSLLIWMVIFNHKAESPTFVIALAGVALYFVHSPRKTEDIILLVITLIFTSLSPSDLFPAAWRKNFFVPYVIKAIPLILLWIKIQWDLWRIGPSAVNLYVEPA